MDRLTFDHDVTYQMKHFKAECESVLSPFFIIQKHLKTFHFQPSHWTVKVKSDNPWQLLNYKKGESKVKTLWDNLFYRKFHPVNCVARI